MKWNSPKVQDYGLNHLKQNVTRVIACQGQPASYAAATTNYSAGNKLAASAPLAPADFTLQNAAAGGRELVVPAIAPMVIDASGSMDHLALVDDANQELLYVTGLTNAQALTAGGTVEIQQTWSARIADVTNP